MRDYGRARRFLLELIAVVVAGGVTAEVVSPFTDKSLTTAIVGGVMFLVAGVLVGWRQGFLRWGVPLNALVWVTREWESIDAGWALRPGFAASRSAGSPLYGSATGFGALPGIMGSHGWHGPPRLVVSKRMTTFIVYALIVVFLAVVLLDIGIILPQSTMGRTSP